MSTASYPEARRLVFPSKQVVKLEAFQTGGPGPGEVRVRIHLSMMSTGTENIVFNRLFEAGSHWDNWVKYPFYPGYGAVGIVEVTGEDVTTLQPGDRVALRVSHRSHAVHKAESCIPIPPGVSFDHAIWFFLAKIAFHGARTAKYSLGDSALIIGAGPIGQMSLRWARAAGVYHILVVEPGKERLGFATAGGATSVINLPIDQARAAVLEACGGKLPRVIMDSTGNAAVFATALTLAADFGVVVLMGDTGQPSQQTLSSEVMRRGLTIAGAHDIHNTPEWDNVTITRFFFALVSEGRFPLEGLTTHTFRPEQCAEAYAVANRERTSTMGMLFDWSAG